MAKARRRRRPKHGPGAGPRNGRPDLVNFALRDRAAVAELKAAHWLERKQRFGHEEAYRVADDLRRYAATVSPARAAPVARPGPLSEASPAARRRTLTRRSDP